MNSLRAGGGFRRFPVLRAVALLLPLLFIRFPTRAGIDTAGRGAPPVLTQDEGTNYLGVWIWDQKTSDKQTCHFWRRFEIPKGAEVLRAQLRISADNAFTAYLDGRELGRGSDWRTLSVYDLTFLLSPGSHILAVEGFNDVDKAGVILGFYADMTDGRQILIKSDTSWRVAPLEDTDWRTRRRAPEEWPPATVVGVLGQEPWWKHPTALANVPPIYPKTVHFWESAWFQITVLSLGGLGLLMSARLMTQLAVQSRARGLLQLERARIARDLHDDLGARVTQLLLTGEEAQGRLGDESEMAGQFRQICDGARDVLNSIDEVVWVVNSQRDTLNDSVIYICKYAENFLRAAAVRCRFDIQRDLPEVSLDLPFRRNLLLTIKESLSNAVKHSGASEVLIRIHLDGNALEAAVEDNGKGFDLAKTSGARNGLGNIIARMKELGGDCRVVSAPGAGCRVEFRVPMPSARSQRGVMKWWFGQILGWPGRRVAGRG